MIVCHGKRYAVYPAGCLVLGGFPIAMLHQGSCPTDYECAACGAKFALRGFNAKLCLGVILLLILWVIAAIASVFLNIYSDPRP